MSDGTTNYLAVDLGASSGRVLLGQWDGERFDLQELHRFWNGPVNVMDRLHWDVLNLWEEIKAGITRYVTQSTRPLAGIGIDTWGVDFALLDHNGRLLGNPCHYRDGRTDGMVERVCDIVSRKEIFEQTGVQFMQINTLFQLFSMVQEEDPLLTCADTLLMMPDLFHYWLTGNRCSEYTVATTSQLYSARDSRWATALLDRLGIPDSILPEVVPPGTVLGELLPAVQKQVGLEQPVPVIAPGSHDTACAVAAIPELDERSAYISSGTWSLMGVESRTPIINERALSLNFTNEGGVNGAFRCLKNIAGLWLLQECRRRWRLEGHEYGWSELLAAAEEAEPLRTLLDPDHPDFMAPDDMPAAIRAYSRRTGQPEPDSVGAIVRCCLESLALKCRWVLESLEQLVDHPLERLYVVGGGSRNRLLSQFTADACQRPVITGPVEATALGNIMMQAVATGDLPDVAAGREAIAASVERGRYLPERAGRWDEAYERFRALIA